MTSIFSPKGSALVPSMILVALIVAVVAAAVVSRSLDSSESIPEIIYGIDDDSLPSSSLADWVSYTSQVSVVTVVNETELPVPPGLSGEQGGGYVGRSVDLCIDETLWTYPGVEPLTGTISSKVNGWIRKDEVSVPFGSLGAERLEVGKTYVIPLVQYDGGWGFLSAGTVLPVDSLKRIAVDPERITNSVSRQLHGKNFVELTQTLESTIPDPVAARYAHLPATERYIAKLRETIPNFVE